MANAYKGEVGFTAAGKTYTLRMSSDALCQVEEATGKSILVLIDQLRDPQTVTFTLMRVFFWSALREHHADVDLRGAGDLMIEAGGLHRVLELFTTLFERTFPQEPEAGDGPPRQPGQVTTGPASVAPGAASGSPSTNSGRRRRARSRRSSLPMASA